jgi:hypothetical protein
MALGSSEPHDARVGSHGGGRLGGWHDVFSEEGIQNRGCGVNRAALCPSQFAACRQLEARNTQNGVPMK